MLNIKIYAPVSRNCMEMKWQSFCVSLASQITVRTIKLHLNILDVKTFIPYVLYLNYLINKCTAIFEEYFVPCSLFSAL